MYADCSIQLRHAADVRSAERLVASDAPKMGVMRLTAAAHLGYASNHDVLVLHKGPRGATGITCHSAAHILSGAEPIMQRANAEQQALLLAGSRFRVAATLRELWISTLEVYMLENPGSDLYMELGLSKRSSDYIDIRRMSSYLVANTRHGSISGSLQPGRAQTRFLEALAELDTFDRLEGLPLHTVLPFYHPCNNIDEEDPRCLRTAFFKRYRAIQDRDLDRIAESIASHDAESKRLTSEQIDHYEYVSKLSTLKLRMSKSRASLTQFVQDTSRDTDMTALRGKTEIVLLTDMQRYLLQQPTDTSMITQRNGRVA